MLEVDPEDGRRMLRPNPDDRSLRILLLIMAVFASLAVAGAYYVHPEWFAQRYWQSRGMLSREGPADEEFAAVYTKYGMPALRRAAASSPEIRPHLAALNKEPCNKRAIFQLSITLEQRIGLREVAAMLQGYAKACPDSTGEQYRASELLYLSGDFKASIDIATQVLALQPGAANPLYLRGRALQSEGRLEEALQDYMTAIRLLPEGKHISPELFMRMSQSYEALNRYCEAIAPIQVYIAYEPETRSTPQLENKISELSKKGKCSSSAKGEVRVPRRTTGVVTLPAEINGVQGNFVIDTGASFVTVSKAFAAKAQVTPMRTASVELTTANGVIAGTLATAKTVLLSAVSAETVPVVIIDKAPGANVDGLLGMSFLSRFNVSMTDKELVIGDKNQK
jgi:clan AA aspartic protease (TIGR02281 family)